MRQATEREEKLFKVITDSDLFVFGVFLLAIYGAITLGIVFVSYIAHTMIGTGLNFGGRLAPMMLLIGGIVIGALAERIRGVQE